MHRRALDEYEKALGEEHPETLRSVENLAGVLPSQGKYEAAEMMNRRALEGIEKALGKEHSSTLASMNNLAGVLLHQGKYEAAEEMNRRALDGYEKALGEEHPRTLTNVSNLADVLRYQGKYEAAAEVNRRVLGTRRSKQPLNDARSSRMCELGKNPLHTGALVGLSGSNLIKRSPCAQSTKHPTTPPPPSPRKRKSSALVFPQPCATLPPLPQLSLNPLSLRFLTLSPLDSLPNFRSLRAICKPSPPPLFFPSTSLIYTKSFPSIHTSKKKKKFFWV